MPLQTLNLPSIYGVDISGALGQPVFMLTKDKVAKKLANRLRQLRQSRGISQENLAIESGLGRSYYWRVEQGLINVTLETLVRLANALKIDMVDLFEKSSASKNR